MPCFTTTYLHPTRSYLVKKKRGIPICNNIQYSVCYLDNKSNNKTNSVQLVGLNQISHTGSKSLPLLTQNPRKKNFETKNSVVFVGNKNPTRIQNSELSSYMSLRCQNQNIARETANLQNLIFDTNQHAHNQQVIDITRKNFNNLFVPKQQISHNNSVAINSRYRPSHSLNRNPNLRNESHQLSFVPLTPEYNLTFNNSVAASQLQRQQNYSPHNISQTNQLFIVEQLPNSNLMASSLQQQSTSTISCNLCGITLDHQNLQDHQYAHLLQNIEYRAQTNNFVNHLRPSPLLKNKNSRFVGSICSICLETYTENENLKCLPCIHTFHTACINEWLRRSIFCPICKHPTTVNNYYQRQPNFEYPRFQRQNSSQI